MPHDRIDNNRSGDNINSGNSYNKTVRGPYDRAYFGAKQETDSYGIRMMAENNGRKPEYSNSFRDFDPFRNVSFDSRDPDGERPFGSDPDFREGAGSGSGTDGSNSAGSRGGAPLFDVDDGSYAEGGRRSPEFDHEEENSFIFFGDSGDDGENGNGGYGGSEDLDGDDADDDVKIYHTGAVVRGGSRTASGTAKAGAKKPAGDDFGDGEEDPQDEENFDDEFFDSVFTDKNRGLKTILIALAVLAVLGLGIFLTYKLMKSNTLGNDKIYSGIRINGYDLGGMTRDEVADYVRRNYVTPVEKAKVTVKLGDSFEEAYPVTDFFICPDPEAIADEAYSYARKGSDSDRLKLISDLKDNPYSIQCAYGYDGGGIQKVIELAGERGFSAVVDPTFDVRDEGIVFTSGKNGARVDRDKFRKDLENMIDEIQNNLVNIRNQGGVENVTIEIESEASEFKPLDAGLIMSEAYLPPVDAGFYKDGGTVRAPIKINDDINGRTLDPVALAEIVNKINSGENIPYTLLQYVPVKADVTAATLRSSLYTTRLGRVISLNTADPFSGGTDGGRGQRADNMSRACELIGTIELLPDEEMSFLDVIGGISSANRFVQARENVNDQGDIISGGGISQVATALYECALRSGLSVPRVWNSQYLPNYGISGFDAYISVTGGNFDLIIKNSKSAPVRISAAFVGNNIEITIDGPDTDAGAIVLVSNLAESGVNQQNTGTVYKYKIAKKQGGAEQNLGTVTYEKYGEGVVPVSTESPEPTTSGSAAPDTTDTEQPSETPGGSEEPSDTACETETPGDTEQPTGTSGETAAPDESSNAA